MLKGAADNRTYLPPIGDQGSEGSCVHWAGTYHTKTANMKRKDPTLNLNATSNQCSPRFTYNLTNAGRIPAAMDTSRSRFSCGMVSLR